MVSVKQEQNVLVDGSKFLKVLRQSPTTVVLQSHFEQNGLMSPTHYALLSDVVNVVEALETFTTRVARQSEQRIAGLQDQIESAYGLEYLGMRKVAELRQALDKRVQDHAKEKEELITKLKSAEQEVGCLQAQLEKANQRTFEMARVPEKFDEVAKKKIVVLLDAADKREKALEKEKEELASKLKSVEQKAGCFERRSNEQTNETLRTEKFNEVVNKKLAECKSLLEAADKRVKAFAKENEELSSKQKSSEQKIFALESELRNVNRCAVEAETAHKSEVATIERTCQAGIDQIRANMAQKISEMQLASEKVNKDHGKEIEDLTLRLKLSEKRIADQELEIASVNDRAELAASEIEKVWQAKLKELEKLQSLLDASRDREKNYAKEIHRRTRKERLEESKKHKDRQKKLQLWLKDNYLAQRRREEEEERLVGAAGSSTSEASSGVEVNYSNSSNGEISIEQPDTTKQVDEVKQLVQSHVKEVPSASILAKPPISSEQKSQLRQWLKSNFKAQPRGKEVERKPLNGGAAAGLQVQSNYSSNDEIHPFESFNNDYRHEQISSASVNSETFKPYWKNQVREEVKEVQGMRVGPMREASVLAEQPSCSAMTSCSNEFSLNGRLMGTQKGSQKRNSIVIETQKPALHLSHQSYLDQSYAEKRKRVEDTSRLSYGDLRSELSNGMVAHSNTFAIRDLLEVPPIPRSLTRSGISNSDNYSNVVGVSDASLHGRERHLPYFPTNQYLPEQPRNYQPNYEPSYHQSYQPISSQYNRSCFAPSPEPPPLIKNFPPAMRNSPAYYEGPPSLRDHYGQQQQQGPYNFYPYWSRSTYGLH